MPWYIAVPIIAVIITALAWVACFVRVYYLRAKYIIQHPKHFTEPLSNDKVIELMNDDRFTSAIRPYCTWPWIAFWIAVDCCQKMRIRK